MLPQSREAVETSGGDRRGAPALSGPVRSLRTRTALYSFVFVLVSIAYSIFLFPHWLDEYSAEALKLYAFQPGQTLHTAYLPLDSASYLDTANAPWGELAARLNFFDGLNAGLGSNVSIFFLGKLAHTLSPGNPLLAVAVLNHLLLAFAGWNLAAICRRYGVRFDQFLLLLLANPLLLFSLHTLNKEILGLALVSAMVRAAFWHRFAVVPLVLVALFTRNVFLGFGVLMLIRRPLMRLPFWVPLVAASLALYGLLRATNNAPFGERFGDLTTLTQYYNQQTAEILNLAYTLMQVPFGYVLAYPLVLGINLVSPAFNPRYWADYLDYVNLAQLSLQCSAIAFGALLLTAVLKMRSFRIVQLEPFRLVFLFTVLTSALPFSQHRYLLPIYPFVVLLALTASRQAERPALLPGSPLLGELSQRAR